MLPADLSSRTDRAALPGRVADLGLEPDILVNNAGLSVSAPITKSGPEQQLNLVEVDVAAVVDLCSRFLPGMVERGSGAVLNVSSLAGFLPVPGQAAYGAAKAFVLSYTEGLRNELRGTGVTASALCPGPVATGFDDAAGFAAGERAAVARLHVEVGRRGGARRARRSGRAQGSHRPGPGKPARRGILSSCPT